MIRCFPCLETLDLSKVNLLIKESTDLVAELVRVPHLRCVRIRHLRWNLSTGEDEDDKNIAEGRQIPLHPLLRLLPVC